MVITATTSSSPRNSTVTRPWPTPSSKPRARARLREVSSVWPAIVASAQHKCLGEARHAFAWSAFHRGVTGWRGKTRRQRATPSRNILPTTRTTQQHANDSREERCWADEIPNWRRRHVAVLRSAVGLCWERQSEKAPRKACDEGVRQLFKQPSSEQDQDRPITTSRRSLLPSISPAAAFQPVDISVATLPVCSH